METLLCTDVQAETWASHEVGVGHGYGNVVHLHLGRRPKVGLVINDEVHRGVHGVAGNLMVNDLMRGVERSGIPDELLTESGEGRYEIVCAAESGDETAVAALRDYFELIAPVAGFGAAIVDPDIVVLGGALTPVAHLGVPAFERALAGLMDRPPRVLVSELDQFGAAHGAALIAHHELMQTMMSSVEGIAPADVDTFRALRARR